MRLSARSVGFTLIELLVVITIIVVLLALLTPALDSAIYQAELAVCGAQQSGIGKGAMAYAMVNRRRYPYRGDVIFYEADVINEGSNDLRPLVEPYLGIQFFLDPLAPGEVDLTNASNGPETKVFASQLLWFGYRYVAENTQERGMFKIGDRFTWDGHRFNLLSTDQSLHVAGSFDDMNSDHPDHEGLLHPDVVQNKSWADLFTGSDIGALMPNGSGTTTRSIWISSDGRYSPIDMNVALQDGSVERFDTVVTAIDPRMAEVPRWNHGAENGLEIWMQIPPE